MNLALNMDKKLKFLLCKINALYTTHYKTSKGPCILNLDYSKEDGASLDGNEKGLMYLASELADLIVNKKEGEVKELELPQSDSNGTVKIFLEKVKDPFE